MTNVRSLVQSFATQLKTMGIQSPRWDAEILVAHGLKKPRLSIYSDPDRIVEPELEDRLESLLKRRLKREPLQHLLGSCEFWGRHFRVGPRVLIPRPETELLMEASCSAQIEFQGTVNPTVLDIGTGSGCLAISLALEFPETTLYATDFSRESLSVARQNIETYGLSDRIHLLQGDLYEPIQERGLMGKIDLMVSNPPYIPSASLPDLQSEVRDYEPVLALDGGPDGLDFYRRLLPPVRDLLSQKGIMILEFGTDQLDAIKDLSDQSQMDVRRVIEDGAGNPRVVVLSPV